MSSYQQLLGNTPLSIQRLTITAPAEPTSFAISPVDLGKSVVFPWTSLTKYQYSGNYLHQYTGHLESASSLRVDKGGSSTGAGTLHFSIVDFGSMVKSVQSGFLAAGATSAAIASVDPDKCFVIEQIQMERVGTTSGVDSKNSTHTINTNSISFGSVSRKRHWQIVEFW